MSNKFQLATIQFRSDAKGVNPTIDAIRQSSKDAHDEVDRLEEALKKGIKVMQDANGVDFNVADRLKAVTKEAKGFDQALRELVKGATALETVVKNIRLGEIEASSRAELKGAINAAEARKRSVRETDPESLEMQRELNIVIEESRKQLNNLDRDTQKVIETLDSGGKIAQAVLDKEMKGLKDILALIPQGTDEWNKYNAQLQQMEAHVANIKKQEQIAATSILGQDLSQYTTEDIRKAIDAGRELIKTYQAESNESKTLAKNIAQADEYLKKYGVDAERAALLLQQKTDMMNARMSDLTKLSEGALAETKKFWEAQLTGAERGSAEAQTYEDHIKAITQQQEQLRADQLGQKASSLFGNLGNLSEKQIREAIEAAKEYQQLFQIGTKGYDQYTQAILGAEEYIKKYGIEAERAARKEIAAQEEAERKLREKTDMMLQRMQNLGSLTAEGLQETKKFWEAQLVGAQRGSAEAQRYETFIKTITAEQEHLSMLQSREGAMKLQNAQVTMSEGEMRAAIEDAKKYLQTLSLVDDEYKTVANSIVAAEEYLKRFGLEAERSTALAELKMQEMTKRMSDLPKLSDAALQETKKFWEEQLAGAERGSKEAQTYEQHIKNITDLQNQLTAEQNKNKAQELNKRQFDMMSENEIRSAIEAARQYQQTLSVTSREYQQLTDTILRAEEYIKNYGIEAERAARKEAEAQAEAARKIQEKMDMMTARMSDVTKLTDATLDETKKYWEQQLIGVERNSQAAQVYEGHIKAIVAEQERLAAIQNKQTAQGVFGNLNTMSEQQIRASITAAREYQQTLSVTDDEYQRLSHAIVNAEDYVKKYGIEAERAYRKEINAANEAMRKRQETDQLMRQQLNQGWKLSDSALKAQEQYWRKLIDDPKTAAESLKEYQDNLREVMAIQEMMVQEKGQSALRFFTSGRAADATGDEIKERAEALKAYKGTLRQTTDASEIAEIDRILKSLADSADAAKGSLMSLSEAIEVVNKIDFDPDGKLNFEGTTEELIGAKNALEKELAVVQRGSARYEELREMVDKVNAAIEGTRINQEQVNAILKDPKHASYDQLKMAIDAARKRLNGMRRDTKEQQEEFDALAKSIKEADIEMKKLGNSSKGSATAFDKAWSRLKTYIGLYVGAAVAMQKLTATMEDLMDLSDKMGEVRKTTGFSADEVGRLSENLKKLDVRTALPQLMEVAAAAGQLGLKTEEDVQGFTEAANKLMIALPEMGKEAATEMMRVAIATGEVEKIRKQMEEGIIKGSSATAVAMEKIASTIDRLRASSASTAPEITDFVKRVGAVGAQSGITIDQVAALGSTISSLGMRVEMSATAISRMIPAIKNNAFDIARAIGVTPETVRNLFDTGKGMEAVLLILQHMKDAGMDEDSIEAMMGVGGMKDVMKDLNQQGARAGIVFAGLSQNVDELRRQLVVANQAYEENIAIQNEFDKMNQTVAARWERLKNQVEELFVGDAPQKWLGGIIDGLRWIVDFITGPMRRAFYILIAVLATYRIGLGEALVSLKDYLLNIGKTAESVKKWFTDLNKANLWGAVIAGAIAAAYAVYDWVDSMKEAAREAARFEAELMKEQMKVENLTTAIGKARAKTEDANKEVEEAKKALDAAKKSTDGTRDSTEKLAKAEADLISKEEKKRNAMAESQRLIEQFNTDYGKYLGFMLSEISSNIELAQARELVNDKLRETITLKRKEAALERVEKEMGEGRDDAYADLWDFVQRKATSKDANGEQVADPTKAAKVLNALTRAAQNDKADRKAFENTAKEIFKANSIENYDVLLKRALNYFDELDKIRKKNKVVEQQFDAEESGNREKSQKDLNRQYKAAVSNYEKLEKDYSKATGEAKKKAAANLLKQMDTLTEMVDSSGRYYKMEDEQEKKDYDTFIKNADKRVNGMKAQREKLLKEAGNAYKPRKDINGNTTTSIDTNPWGSRQPAESTNYADMNAEALVTRRKQMKDFVNAIQTDSDVKGVLAEDKALQKAIEQGMSSDMRTVIEWYNTERLKIQDELHARHLTNTGDWMDPKKQKARHKQFKAEMQAYLEELDAYYTERNQKIQDERNNEEITEGEAWLKTIKNESEWHQRRAELQKMYSEKSAEVVKEEQDAIHNIIAERTGDDAAFIEKSIQKTKAFADMVRKADSRGEAEYRKWEADLGLGWERDYLKQQKSINKQVEFMADTLAKERPLNGIVEDMQLALTKMGILEGQVPEKIRFLLGEVESAYTIEVKNLVDRVSKAGFAEWAKQIEGDVQVQQALIAQLRQAYEKIQEAIRKEASRIKKDAEMMWKLMLTPDGKNLKQMTDEALAQLTQQQDSVSRANSLIGAGTASENVATKLAIKQLQLQLDIQKAQFALMKKMGNEKAEYLDKLAKQYELENKTKEAERARMDAANVRKSLELATTEETKKQLEITNQITKEQEEAQNRLYQSLREWADLLASSMQGVMEATHAGDAEYYNELAKLNLTGKGGPGAGTYMVIDNAGTSDATAHYEYLDERAALERQREIENQNATAEAWKKLWDDLNNKMSEQITDWINAMLQNTSLDANTAALGTLTGAINTLTGTIIGQTEPEINPEVKPTQADLYGADKEAASMTGMSDDISGDEAAYERQLYYAQQKMDLDDKVTDHVIKNKQKEKQATVDTNNAETKSTQSTFSKMTLAANMYGIAYQAMSNENLSTTQKFEMMALQAVGNYAIGALTTEMAAASAKAATDSPGVLGKLWKQLGWAAAPVFAIFTGLLGGLMGVATSKIGKAKSTIAQATGASVGAGRLSTGMLTYAEGNVNEFTDPGSLTPGRQYNVDAADGRTYRARYMGTNPKTHLTNGPEFHLSGEKGREMIIDAGTTRQITMNEGEIWRAIQTLSGGGSLRTQRRRSARRGVAAFADGNVEDFTEYTEIADGAEGGSEMVAALQQSLDRNSEVLERALTEGIKGVFDVYGKGGLVDSYDTGKKNVTSHGERY